jgi:maltose O-acetyltransferase
MPSLKVLTVLKEEFGSFSVRMLILQAVASLLPQNSLSRLRTMLYRAFGFSIGEGTILMGTLTVTGSLEPWKQLRIGNYCRINSPIFMELNAPMKIGNNVSIGHHVVLITTDHEVGTKHSRAGDNKTSPVTICDGCWIGAASTILPGTTIADGSIVAAGSLVRKSVPANVLVGGVPARVLKDLGD